MRPSRVTPLGIAAALMLAVTAGGLSYVRHARTIHPKTAEAILTPGPDGDSTVLSSGWRISPAGRHIPTGDMLLGGAISPDGRTLAICNAGFAAHTLHLIDLASEKEIAAFPLARAWNGIAWAPDGRRLYLGGGDSNPLNDVYVYQLGDGGEWTRVEGYKLGGSDPKKTCVAGIALTPDGKNLFALNNDDQSLYVLDSATGAARTHLKVGDHPYACKLAADGKTLYVANLGGSSVAVVDVSNPDQPALAAAIRTGDHPNDIALSADGRLFVSCGNADEVDVIDAAHRRTAERIRTALTPKSPSGSTPDAVAVSPDGKALYVANADNNDICVIDISKPGRSRIAGFIPTGWYPSAVLVTPDGKRIIACSGKGTGSRPNPAKTPIDKKYVGGFPYIGSQLNGLVSFVDAPSTEQLAAYTKQVYANAPYQDSQLRSAASATKTAIPTRVGAQGPIRYVLYIIKENRTYDQVYGDMQKGNGDPSLCLFDREVTPNQHALADQFVLLDNLYCSGEVSADGHPWSTSAYCTDFRQRAWVLSYSGKGEPSGSGTVDTPPAGYLWDACKKAGITYRSYGEYVYASSSAAAPEQKVAGAPGLIGHGSPAYVGIGWPKGRPMRDTDKADAFIEEFRAFERTESIPRYMVMSLGENHTVGTRPGGSTPKACVGSNDVAVGKIVDAISHSSVWGQFAIFIIEDDAQNGPDHVDSHRTAGLVISPYTRRGGAVDSTFYTTCSMLRTMELILGLKPLTQYDAAANPMFLSFTDKADLTPFNLLPARINLAEKNPSNAYGARESARMDFRDFDRAPEGALNRILWKSIKGVDAPVPAPVRSAMADHAGRLHAAIRAQGD